MRGVLLRALKEALPAIESIVGPELGRFFEDIEADGWYDSRVYLETMAFLRQHLSPQAMLFVGNRLLDELKTAFPPLGTSSPREMAHRVGDFHDFFVRGSGAGGWHLESYEPGRAVIIEDSPFSNPLLAMGIIRGGLENTGAYNVRIEVLSDRAEGAPENRYLVEWIHPSGE